MLVLAVGYAACSADSLTEFGSPPGGGWGASPSSPDASAPDGAAPAGSRCQSDGECEARCLAGVCAAPTHDDGKISPSLGETDVDCGGPTAPACNEGQGCAADTDCRTAACSAAGRCVIGPSCRNDGAGLTSCGALETGTAGAAHESCCRTLPLPSNDRRLDKYEITAGRVRAFIEAMALRSGGNPNVRSFAKEYAGAHPTSQLAELERDYPGLLDVLPDNGASAGPVALPFHLGLSALDAINTNDGCLVKDGTSYGAATYWQAPDVLKQYGAGALGPNGPTGTRAYGPDTLDEKSMNCAMPMLLATFCAWDGGELARTSDYHQIWGRHPYALAETTVFGPWDAIVPIGEFNWRNGHGGRCGKLSDWPGCVDGQPAFYAFPAGGVSSNDDAPAVGAPGRFVRDVTAIKSPTGEAWFDVGGNLMEAAWPTNALALGATPIEDVCDSFSGGGGSCARAGVRRYAGPLKHVALVGYSFEIHSRRSEAYLAGVVADESAIVPADAKPVSFQYGKVGGRCARPLE